MEWERVKIKNEVKVLDLWWLTSLSILNETKARLRVDDEIESVFGRVGVAYSNQILIEHQIAALAHLDGLHNLNNWHLIVHGLYIDGENLVVDGVSLLVVYIQVDNLGQNERTNLLRCLVS